jgi:hypothetical protein
MVLERWNFVGLMPESTKIQLKVYYSEPCYDVITIIKTNTALPIFTRVLQRLYII